MSVPVSPRAKLDAMRPPRRMAARLRRLIPSALFSISAATASADAVFWGSRAFGAHETSGGKVWGADFTLQLGVFRNGFKPMPGNIDGWQVHWVVLGTAAFDSEERRYAGLADDSLALPAGADPQVYFWASDGSDLTKGPEWLLLAHPDWKWNGKSSGPAALPKMWIAEEAAGAIVGETNAHQLASAAVRPVPVELTEWLAAWFPDDADLRHPDADPDGDGLSNRAEYLLGSDPTAATTAAPRMRRTADGIRLALDRNPYALSNAVLETSADLQTWTPAAATTEAERPDRIEMLAVPQPGAAARFFRFNLQPATAE